MQTAKCQNIQYGDIKAQNVTLFCKYLDKTFIHIYLVVMNQNEKSKETLN